MVGGSFYKNSLLSQNALIMTEQIHSCIEKCFDLLRNSPLSSIHIHFGDELLVLAALLTLWNAVTKAANRQNTRF